MIEFKPTPVVSSRTQLWTVKTPRCFIMQVFRSAMKSWKNNECLVVCRMSASVNCILVDFLLCWYVDCNLLVEMMYTICCVMKPWIILCWYATSVVC